MTDADVNCFVIEPMRYIVCGVAGTPFSKSARPYPALTSVSRPRMTTTDTPGASPAATKAFARESMVERTTATRGRCADAAGCCAWSAGHETHTARAHLMIFGICGWAGRRGW